MTNAMAAAEKFCLLVLGEKCLCGARARVGGRRGAGAASSLRTRGDPGL